MTLAGFTRVPEWQDGKLYHLPTLSSMGHNKSGEGVLVGRARRVWRNKATEYICIYPWGDSKEVKGTERRDTEKLKEENQQAQKKAT